MPAETTYQQGALVGARRTGPAGIRESNLAHAQPAVTRRKPTWRNAVAASAWVLCLLLLDSVWIGMLAFVCLKGVTQ